MTYGIYEVLPGHSFRGHRAGEQFEARMDRPAEPRAVRRGVLSFLGTVDFSLAPGTFSFPTGWLSTEGKE